MNFLAHLYLSGDDEAVMLGNFMADFVKGRPEDRIPDSPQKKGIIRGIRLHRQIDAFTDSHEVVLQSKLRLRPVYRKYAGVIADMFYDHLLAAHWAEYAAVSLAEFAERTYATIQRNREVFPPEMDGLLHYMITENWLLGYARIEGIDRALRGMSQRTVFESGMEKAASELRVNYPLYAQEFKTFFPQLTEFSRWQLTQF